MQEYNPSDGKRAGLYARVSTREQAEKGYSLDAQIEQTKDFCRYRGLYYVRIYKDAGYSGSDTDRPLLQKMLDDAESGKFDKIIVWRIDRLSRNTLDLLLLVDYLNSLGIKIISATEPFDTSTPIGEFMITMMGSLAKMEREVIIERIKLGQQARAKEGKWKGGIPPLGYNYNGDTGKLEINKDEVDVVKIIFEKYLGLGTLSTVQNCLESKGINTRKGNKHWHIKVIRKILSNETYTGRLSFNDISDVDENLKIIDYDTFCQVQKQLQERKVHSPNGDGRYSKMPRIPKDRYCYHCSAIISPEMSFCSKCGTRLKGDYSIPPEVIGLNKTA